MKFNKIYESDLAPGFMDIGINRNIDERGSFHRFFCNEDLNKILNSNFTVEQINISNSIKKGTFRGFHYQEHPKRERKIITAISGSFLDIVININKQSKNYGQIDWRKFSALDGNIISVSENCAHAILSLEDNSIAVYLSDTPYTPELERGISILNPNLKIPKEITEKVLIISDKDKIFINNDF